MGDLATVEARATMGKPHSYGTGPAGGQRRLAAVRKTMEQLESIAHYPLLIESWELERYFCKMGKGQCELTGKH